MSIEIPSVGRSVRRSIGPSVRRSVGPSVRRSVGPSVRQSVGPLVHWSVGPLVRWSVGPSLVKVCSRLVIQGVCLSHTTDAVVYTALFLER